MSDNTSMSKGKIIAKAAVWFVLIGVGVVAYKYWWHPAEIAQEEEQKEAEHQATLDATSSNTKYRHTVPFATDGFSGYSPWRSPGFRTEAGRYSIRLDIKDDGADYPARLRAIADGSVPMGVFTIDALYKVSAQLNDTPATIIMLGDETKGADAMVGPGRKFPNIDSLNSPDLKIVCLADSPSETLARVVMDAFNLDQLPANPFEFKDSPQAVFDAYKASSPTDNKVFVLWEPDVSQVLKNPDYRVIVDSSKFSGYIVDCVVVQRDFLIKNEDVVTNIIKAYLTTVFNSRNDMKDMVIADAKSLGEPLTDEQATKLVEGIWWKNTQENFAHFGLTSAPGIQPMEDMCRNISNVLLKTGAMSSDPTNGRPNLMYYDGIMRKLFDSSWHPGFGREMVREERTLPALSDEDRKKLRPVGTLQVPRLVFARGTSRVSQSSLRTLDDLAEKLKTWPQYYLTVRGNTSSKGDVDANRALAEQRAQAASDYLKSKGIAESRIYIETSHPNGSTTVAFILGEMPY
jgi:flagellar motor protein MotB